ncbi:MAG: ATP-dependent DNA helicase [Acholeplasmatales bacterium]|nr:ATP-dependent DNA helicase [Acholeplasmatales bacterium]
MELVLAVKDIVKFLYSTADLSNDLTSDAIGSEIHSYWQKLYKKDIDKKEYYVKNRFTISDYDITVHGFIDGLLNNGLLIEEIKTAFTDINTIDVKKEHLAQAKMYAYLYLLESNFEAIDIVITYIHFESKKESQFFYNFSFKDLEEFFYETLNEYISWISKLDTHSMELINSVKDLKFPFKSYRKNQLEFIRDCYKNINDKNILFAIAPTGVGKTISTLFPAVKSITERNQKIFYLTAKSSGKTVCLETVKMFVNSGCKIKTIELTAKEKMCATGDKLCNPDKCPFMVSYYEKLKYAIYDMYDNKDIIDRKTIIDKALEYKICPFEYQLDLSNYADIIVGDYNYAFCPRTHLVRYFDTFDYKQILLIDEAHNLINRSKEMYSSTISLNDVNMLNEYIKKLAPSMNRLVDLFYDIVSNYDRDFNYLDDIPFDFLDTLRRIVSKAEKVLLSEKAKKIRDNALSYYFNLKNFLKISEFFDKDFRFVIDYDMYSIKCMDASKFIKTTLDNYSTSSIFFSATMHPIDYYKNLITQNNGNEITIPSPFPKDNLLVLIRKNTFTKYTDRENSIEDILECIDELVKYKVGNYIVFFPSYEYMNMVVQRLNDPDYECIIQSKNLTEDEKDAILNEFSTHDTTKVGFFIMGSIFSEGIDYLGDMLSGVMIVTVSLPPFDEYNNMLKDYFDSTNRDGLQYAYQIPGISKVIQSVGRLIRSENDKGVAILYDERFSYSNYKALLPSFWKNIRYCFNNSDVKKYITFFKK